MALRYAERQKNLQSLTRRNYRASLKAARLHNSNGTHILRFAPGITVVSGGNGAGKSSTLGAIWKCLTGHDGISRRLPYWLVTAEISGTYNGSDWTASYDAITATFAGHCPAPAEYIDASAETERILTLIRQDDNSADLVEGIDPTTFDDKQVSWLSYVLRRRYDEVRVFEVTAFSEDDEPVPFFEVGSMGKTYGLPDMGRGELSATYLLWRLGNVEHGSIVLVEEPESHLAAFSQQALTEAVIATVVERDLTLVVSSHSPSFIRALPPGSVVLLSSSPSPSIRSGLEISEVAQHLGLQSACDAILLTEDIVAEGLLCELLKFLAPDLASRVITRYVPSGESGVIRMVRELQNTISPGNFIVLGVLDGDQRAGVGSEDISYLMGAVAPDELLRAMTTAWRNGAITDWEPSFVDRRDRLEMALELLDGYDHHDWITELAKKFGGYSRILGDLVQLCLQDSRLAEDADELVRWIRTKLE